MSLAWGTLYFWKENCFQKEMTDTMLSKQSGEGDDPEERNVKFCPTIFIPFLLPYAIIRRDKRNRYGVLPQKRGIFRDGRKNMSQARGK